MSNYQRTALAVGCLFALGAAAAPASAQTAIRAGQTVRGSLSTSDPRAGDDSYYDLYTYRGRRGERLTITLRSDAFDSFLSFGRMNGAEFDSIETDDDGAGGTDARLVVTLAADGVYAIRANSLSEGETGDYQLSLTSGVAPTPRPATMGSIAVGQTVRGTLAETDPQLESDDTYYDLYRISGRAGQRVEIVMTSTAFDGYMAFGRMDGGELDVMKSDDDGAGDNNPRIQVTFPETGQYVIRANSLSEGETGAYTLAVRELPPLPAPPAPVAIRAGQTVRGSLAETDPQADDDSYYDAFVYTGRAGEQLTITMESDDFDTYLVIGRMNGTEFEQLESNDDGEDTGTHAQLVFTLPSAGRYVIRANSLSKESTGAYTLRVVSGR